MPDPALTSVTPQRQSPLASHARQGRFGAVLAGGPGVRLTIRHPLSMVTVISRAGKEASVGEAFGKLFGAALPQPGTWNAGKGVSIAWAGPGQYLVIAPGQAEGQLFAVLRQELAGAAAVTDQSHGRVMIRIEGPAARRLLAKGTPVDLHPRAFAQGRVALTQMAHVGVHLAQVGPDAFEISLFRGFSENFWEWLTEQAAEFGYEVM